jgi:hypothetical protein
MFEDPCDKQGLQISKGQMSARLQEKAKITDSVSKRQNQNFQESKRSPGGWRDGDTARPTIANNAAPSRSLTLTPISRFRDSSIACLGRINSESATHQAAKSGIGKHKRFEVRSVAHAAAMSRQTMTRHLRTKHGESLGLSTWVSSERVTCCRSKVLTEQEGQHSEHEPRNIRISAIIHNFY